jgi:hypothetical protein
MFSMLRMFNWMVYAVMSLKVKAAIFVIALSIVIMVNGTTVNRVVRPVATAFVYEPDRLELRPSMGVLLARIAQSMFLARFKIVQFPVLFPIGVIGGLVLSHAQTPMKPTTRCATVKFF